MSSTSDQLPRRMPCPQCSTPLLLEGKALPAYFPFCSERCRLLDLGAWANAEHVIAGKPVFQAPDDEDFE